MDEKRLVAELRDIRVQLDGVLGMQRFLLASRLVQDGHAKDLREAGRIIKDKARLDAIYPAPRED